MKSCFVCMPLIEELLPIYEHAIVPEIKDVFGARCECTKADDIRRPGMVTEKVVQCLLNADLVIAVMADPRLNFGPNPNVMYELGVAHSFRKPALVVTDAGNTLPFDLRAVETIALDFSRLGDEVLRPGFLYELRRSLRASLTAAEVVADLEKRRLPSNPLTTQLAGTHIFLEDAPWLWGYCQVLARERQARSLWEITRDLFWPTEPLFFESLKEAIRDGRKHYFIVPEDDGIRRKIEATRRQLQMSLPAEEIDRLLRFVAIDKKHFLLWPIAIVLYDADLATCRGGIMCEPMTSQIGKDPTDDEVRQLFNDHQRNGGNLESFERLMVDRSWIERHREATFDIALDVRVVDALATSFAQIWNEKVWEDARNARNEAEHATLIKNWLIRGDVP